MTQEIIVFVAGIAVGAMNAIAGGGLLIGFPVMLAIGIPPLTANITGHLVVLPGNISAAYGYRKYMRKVDNKYLLLLIPTSLGAAVGAILLRNTSPQKFEDIIPILVFMAVGLFAFQPYLHFHLNRHLRGALKGIKPLVVIGLAIFPLAIYGGYFGAGFGFIMLAFLGFTKLHEIHQMNGLKNLAALSISVVSLIFLYSTGLINWKYGLIMAAGGTIGAYYGATLTQKVSSHALRIVIIIIGVVTASFLAFKTY